MRNVLLPSALMLCSVWGCAGPGAGSAPAGPRSNGFEVEPNDRSSEATEITGSARIRGGIGSQNDNKDCYSVVPSANGVLTFRLQNQSSVGSESKLRGPTLADSSGAMLAYTPSDVEEGATVEGSAAVTAGATYIITIEPRDRRHIAYELTTSFAAD